jgi:D-alanyl-D-alanine carboxypeptidase
MDRDPLFETTRSREHGWVTFIVVAAALLGTLLVISRVVDAQSQARPVALLDSSPIQHSLGGSSYDPESQVLPGVWALAIATAVPQEQAVAAEPSTAEALPAPPAQEVAEEAAPPPAEESVSEEPPAAVEEAPPPAPPPPPAPRITAPPPALSARSAAVMERSCGELVWGLRERERLAPASLTKIMTALVVADRADLNSIVVSNISASQLARTTGSSTMGLEPGMRVTVRDLIYGLMLPSGNDAALLLADHIGGNLTTFLVLMNLKAQQIGMRDSYFTNPHGLDHPGIFSTAYDMAIAGRAYLENPLLAEIAIAPAWQTMSNLNLKNGNRLLQTYPGSFGVKIGYTIRAKQTFVGAAERGGRQLIISLLVSEDRYGDAARLLDWAFAHTEPACR